MLAGPGATPGPFKRVAGHLSDPLYRTGYLLIAGTGTTAVLGIVFWVLAAHAYSPRVVGISSAAISAMLFIASACQLGLPAVLVRDLPRAGARKRAVIVHSYLLMFGAAILFGTAAALTSGLWSHSLSFLHRDPLWSIGFPLATAFYAIFLAQDLVMTALDAPGWVPIENTAFSLAKLFVLIAAVSLSPGAGPFVAWSVPAVIAVAAITMLIFGRLIPRSESRAPAVESFDTRRFVGMAASNQVALLFTYVTTLLMPVVVASATNASETAFFYVPWSIASGLGVIAVNTSLSLTLESSLDHARLAELTRRTVAHTLRMVVPIAIAVAVFAPYILRLYGERYAVHGTALLRLLALAMIPNVLYTVGEALLRIAHRPLLLLFSQAGQSVLFLALTFVLFSAQGINSVGIALIIAQTAVAGALLATVMRPFLFGRGRDGGGP